MDTGRNVYFDNCYGSPEVLKELFYRQSHASGTVRNNRENLPEVVITAKLKPREPIFRCNGPMFALKWGDKRAVTVIFSTIHDATEVVTGKKHTGGNVIKSEVIFSYTNLMSQVILSDQYLVSYSFLKKGYEMGEKAFY